MKQKFLIPGLAVAGGVAAFALRLVQNSTGFEADTGLAVPGNFAGIALPVLFLALAAAFFLLSRKVPKSVGDAAFTAVFPFSDAAALMLPIMGIFLIALSGAADAAMGLQILPGAMFGGRIQLLLGVLSIAGAVGLFLAAAACRRTDREFPPVALLPVIVMLVVRLVVTYRSVSTDPTLAAYYVELMALVFLTLSFFRLAGFAFADAAPRRFRFYAPMAVVFSMAAIAEIRSIPLSSLALYVGGGLTVLGFLAASHFQDAPETEQD